MIRRVARGKRQGEGGEQAGYGCTCVVCCGCGGRTSIPCGCTCACLRTSYPAHRPREICHQANPSKQPSNSQQVVTIWNGLRRQIAKAVGSQPLTCRSDRSSPGLLSCVDHLVEMEPLLWKSGGPGGQEPQYLKNTWSWILGHILAHWRYWAYWIFWGVKRLDCRRPHFFCCNYAKVVPFHIFIENV